MWKKSTYDNHLGGLEDETFVGSSGAATRPLPEAETEITEHFSIRKRSRFHFINITYHYIYIKNFSIVYKYHSRDKTYLFSESRSKF